MREILFSGKSSFNVEVPFKLIQTGPSEEKPLIVYLHGFNQNIDQFQELTEDMMAVEAYHLFLQGPYPIYDRSRRKEVEDWGRAWYLYDGRQEQFVQSLERASEFVQALIDDLLKQIQVSRMAVLGYSMGGYLGGYYALSRWKQVNELIVVGARIKTEVFEDRPGTYDRMNVLALHGAKDRSVKSTPQKKSCEQLSQWGAEVTFKELEESHKLSPLFINKIKKWIYGLGYE